MKKSGRFANDVATVFHVTAIDKFGVPTTDTLVLRNVMVTRTDAQGDSVMGNSPQNTVKLFYYPGRSTVNECYIRAPRLSVGDIVVEGEYFSRDEAMQDGALLFKVRSMANCGHIAKVEHIEVICG